LCRGRRAVARHRGGDELHGTGARKQREGHRIAGGREEHAADQRGEREPGRDGSEHESGTASDEDAGSGVAGDVP